MTEFATLETPFQLAEVPVVNALSPSTRHNVLLQRATSASHSLSEQRHRAIPNQGRESIETWLTRFTYHADDDRGLGVREMDHWKLNGRVGISRSAQQMLQVGLDGARSWVLDTHRQPHGATTVPRVVIASLYLGRVHIAKATYLRQELLRATNSLTTVCQYCPPFVNSIRIEHVTPLTGCN